MSEKIVSLLEEYAAACEEKGIGSVDSEEAARPILAEIAALQSRAEKAEAKVEALTAQLAMTVLRLGGEVEGAPTHAVNFLQMIDALVDMKARVLALAEEWERRFDEDVPVWEIALDSAARALREAIK